MVTLINISKSAPASLVNVARHTTSLVNVPHSGGTHAMAGMYYGFGAFTYADNELLTSGSTTALINIAKH